MSPSFLARLAATTAARNRLQGRRPDPATTSPHGQRAHHRDCRAAGIALRAAVADAHRVGVPAETIARATGFSPGYVRLIVHRAHTHTHACDPAAPFRIQGELMTGTPPWSVGEHLWRKLDQGRNHHLGTLTRVWHDGTRWMVEYEYGFAIRGTATAPASEMYRAGPMIRPV